MKHKWGGKDTPMSTVSGETVSMRWASLAAHCTQHKHILNCKWHCPALSCDNGAEMKSALAWTGSGTLTLDARFGKAKHILHTSMQVGMAFILRRHLLGISLLRRSHLFLKCRLCNCMLCPHGCLDISALAVLRHRKVSVMRHCSTWVGVA